MQYRLSTLFLLFVVLWASLAVFGGVWGIMLCVAAVVATILLNQFQLSALKWIASQVFRLRIVAGLVSLLIILAGLYVLLPIDSSARESVRRMSCTNNLKTIALALYNYRQAKGCFPPAYFTDKNGKATHSWRVLILPYLEGCDGLYKQYSLDEPWDGPNNRKLLTRRPSYYACPENKDACRPGEGRTTYVAVLGSNAAWREVVPRSVGSLDGRATSTTITVVETADAGIQWTEPRDLSLDAIEAAVAAPSALTVSSRHGTRKDFFLTYRLPSGAHVAMADGSVRYLPPAAVAPEVLPELLKIGGCTDERLRRLSADWRPPLRQVNWDNIAALAIWLLSVGWLSRRALRSRRNVVENDFGDTRSQNEALGS